MGKIIHTTNSSTQRKQAIRAIASALQEYKSKERTENEVLDLSAFVLMRLKDISASAEQTAGSWEKRDYWVKADTFRSQWAWVDKPLHALMDALPRKDLASLDRIYIDLAHALPLTKPAKRKLESSSWSGSWHKLYPDS